MIHVFAPLEPLYHASICVIILRSELNFNEPSFTRPPSSQAKPPPKPLTDFRPQQNMGSIDHTVNSLIRHDGDKMCKAEFAAALTKEIGETSREVSEREVDLIFEVRRRLVRPRCNVNLSLALSTQCPYESIAHHKHQHPRYIDLRSGPRR